LIGTVTDGDIRRAILNKVDLGKAVTEVLEKKGSALYKKPITAPVGTSEEQLMQIMEQYVIRQIPLLDENGRVVELALLSEIIKKKELPLKAVVMAGGAGLRMRPLTKDMPKPMLPIGDRPLMEIIIDQLKRSGIKHVNISTHYMKDKIKEYFKDGQEFDVEINYVTEELPLGTAGAIGLLEKSDTPLLIINGDILTRVNFQDMLSFHQKHQADLTVGVRQYEVEVPYGVVENDGPFIHQLREKPTFSFLVNAGIYLMEPRVHDCIPINQKYDMTDLIEKLIKEGRTVVSFPVMEYWLDIGEPDDYHQAQEDHKKWESLD
jgi:NDP-sugar pyrophosphorylase family protein